MLETTTPGAAPALDHIIERPRLIERLETDGGSRVTVLTAPAGYGKTVLARQWAARQIGPVGWYRTGKASGDVALLAVELDELLASLAPELAREPLRVPAIAAVNPSAEPLGRAMVQSFASLTREVLLVVDEWEAADTDQAAELMSTLVEGLDIRFLFTTRTRPGWFTPRMEVYGDGLEIAMDELAMTDAEAAEVLAGSGAAVGRGRLMRTAQGWPAVLGLAAMSGDVDLAASPVLSETLYEFLADELLATAAPATREAMMVLALASVSAVPVARIALGKAADAVISDAVGSGLLAVIGRGSLALHPLLRELLVRRFGESDVETRTALLTQCRNLVTAGRLDEALSVAEATRDPRFAADALAAAVDDLLAAGRTSTLQRWVAAARAAGAAGGVIDYAESEALMRAGELDRAVALGTQAAASLDGDLAARAHLVAGRAAHMTGRFPLAEEHAGASETLAESAKTLEEAFYLRFLAGIGTHAPDLRERLEEFERHAASGVEPTLRVAGGALTLAGHGDGDLIQAIDDARRAVLLAEEQTDPLVHTSFLSTYSHCLILAGRYEESLEHIDTLVRVAESYGIGFPVRYAKIHRARALVGLRRFGQAARLLDSLERETKDDPGTYFRANLPLQRARLHASVGDVRRAFDVLSYMPSEPAGPSSGGELLAWRALLHAVVGEPEQARALADKATHRNRALQSRALALVSEALVYVDAGDPDGATARLADTIHGGVWDAVIVAVRAAPRFGAFIADQTEWRGWLQRLLDASADRSLANSLGLDVPRAAKRKIVLTPRETEVHELLAQGLTNDEIARLLYISVSTTKVHIKHIFEKLGVRSRAEAVRALSVDT
jgi:LuxR family maltose regulon positive regulatory protein